MAFQTKHNLWPEPIREEGTTHTVRGEGAPRPSKHAKKFFADGVKEELHGGVRAKEQHKFDTRVAAISPETGHLFVYGDGKFYLEPRRSTPYVKRWDITPEVACFHVNEDGSVDAATRYNSYLGADAESFVKILEEDTEVILERALQDDAKLKTKLSLAPSDPPDERRKIEMARVLGALADSYGTGESAAAEDLAKLKCGVTTAHLTYPLQRATFGPDDFGAGWGAVQGEMTLIVEAYAGHHPVAFALVEVVEGTKHTKGILVAEFNDDATELEHLLFLRDFVDDDEREEVLLPGALTDPRNGNGVSHNAP